MCDHKSSRDGDHKSPPRGSPCNRVQKLPVQGSHSLWWLGALGFLGFIGLNTLFVQLTDANNINISNFIQIVATGGFRAISLINYHNLLNLRIIRGVVSPMMLMFIYVLSQVFLLFLL